MGLLFNNKINEQPWGITDRVGLDCWQHVNYISSPMFENKYIWTMSPCLKYIITVAGETASKYYPY